MVSVIVPIYNVEKYLKTCVDSILNQTMKDYEVILVDDGSVDSSPQICDEYAERYEYVRVIHKKNGGLSSARNAGINLAGGDYLMFIDSDDYIHPKMLELMYQNVIEQQAEVCICDALIVEESDNALRDIPEMPSTFHYDRKKCIEMIYKDWKCVVTWNKIYAAHLFETLRFKEGIINEDEEIILKIYEQVHSVVRMDACFYYYRRRDDSIMGQGLSYNNIALFDIYRERNDTLKSLQDKEALELNARAAIHRCYNFYFLYREKLTPKTVKRMRKELLWYTARFHSLFPWKMNVKFLLFVISPSAVEKIQMSKH